MKIYRGTILTLDSRNTIANTLVEDKGRSVYVGDLHPRQFRFKKKAEEIHLGDKVQRIVLAVTIVHEDDEVGQVQPLLVADHVRHLEAKSAVLHVGERLRVLLDDVAEDFLPPRIADGVIDMRFVRCRLVQYLLAGNAEVDGRRRTCRQKVVQQHGHARRLLFGRPADDGVVHAVTGFVRVVGKLHDNVRRCTALAFEISAVYPLGEQGADLTEQQHPVHRLKLLPWVFPFEIVAENARETYGKSVPLGLHGMDMHNIRRKNRRRVLDS